MILWHDGLRHVPADTLALLAYHLSAEDFHTARSIIKLYGTSSLLCEDLSDSLSHTPSWIHYVEKDKDRILQAIDKIFEERCQSYPDIPFQKIS